MSNRNIAIVTLTANLREDHPAHQAVTNFINIYREQAEITIIGPSDYEKLPSNPSYYTLTQQKRSSLLYSILNHIHNQLEIARFIFQNRGKYDCIFFHIGGEMLVIPLITTKVTQTPSVVFSLGSITESLADRGHRGLLNKLLSIGVDTMTRIVDHLATKRVYLSESMAEKSANERTELVANLNYIDTDEFNKTNPWNERNIDILFLGRLANVKGILPFIDSLRHAAEDQPNLTVKIAGKGSEEDQAKQQVSEYGLDSNVEFLGWVDRSDVPEILNQSRLLALPSESEGVPKSVLEAMACGTIPVATNVGGIKDILTDGERGFVVESNNPETFSRAMLNALSTNRSDMSARCREYIKENQSYSATRKQYIELLSDIN